MMLSFKQWPCQRAALSTLVLGALQSFAFADCTPHLQRAADLSRDLFQQGQQRLAAEKALQDATTEEARAQAQSQIRSVDGERGTTITAIEKIGGVIARVCPPPP
jgi:hypothetical protein